MASVDKERIDFVVGSEIAAEQIFSAADVSPLLKALIEIGADRASLADGQGRVLLAEGEECDVELPEAVRTDLRRGTHQGPGWRCAPLHHEGEPIAFIYIGVADSTKPDMQEALIRLASTTLHIVMRNTVKRLLTTEVHTTTVQQSYEELLEINRRLQASERKYRELAGTLQQRVEQRTEELRKAHTTMLQQEKMASIGQLAGGLAHEVNTPLHYISGNLESLASYFDDLCNALESYRSGFKTASPRNELLATSEELYRRIDVPSLVEDSVDLVRESLEGTEQIRGIVANLKGFSHVDNPGNKSMDLNAEIDRTLQVLNQIRKDRAAVFVKRYGEIPRFEGNPALMSQVFLNLLSNALESRNDGLVVTVQTAWNGKEIVVSVIDNGGGIPDEIRERIFEPFFTTKDVGEGTGMGLAVVYDVVTKHDGRIVVDSDEGRGTRFDIILPAGSRKGS